MKNKINLVSLAIENIFKHDHIDRKITILMEITTNW